MKYEQIDRQFDPTQIDKILAVCPHDRPSFALLLYSGAGPYPQTYEFESDESLQAAAHRKQEQFLTIYDTYIKKLKPQRAMPFAGKYFLAGPLSSLNGDRGVPDIYDREVFNFLNKFHV